MMLSIGAKDNVEEVLVARLDHSNTILHILYHNNIFGKLANKILGKSLQNIGLKQDTYTLCEAHLNKVFVNLKKEIFQLSIGNRYYQISYLPEWNSKGRVDTILTIVRDTTNEQSLRAELTISQNKWQMAQQVAMLGYFDRDLVNEKLYWSDQIYKLLNLASQEKHPSIELLLSFIHPEDVEIIRKEIVAMPTEDFSDLEYRIIRNDGSIGWMHHSIQSIFDKNGELLRQFGIVQDITEWKILTLELQKRTEQLQTANTLLTAKQVSAKMAGKIAKLGYFEWDQITNHLYWSDQQYRNFGYKPAEVTLTIELFRSQIHPDDWHLVPIEHAEFDGKSYVESQIRIIKADGSLGWLYSRINVITNEQGCCIKLFGTTQDITQHKQTEERIHSVEKELAFMNQLYSRSTYLNKLLFNDYPVEHITKALNEFGIKTQIAHCCFVVRLAEKLAYNTDIVDDTIPPTIVRKQAVLIWLAEREWGLVWRCHDNIVILTSLLDYNVASKQNQLKLAHNIIAEIEKVFPHFYVNIGISGLSSIPVNFRELYEKAYRAVIIATSMNHSSATHCDDIGLYEVAFQLLQDQNTCGMVQNTIGRLAEYDKARGSNLLITLECILEHGSLKTVAQHLFLHHNTVIWRKRKIEEFLEMPLDKMETKMLLLLYIKIWNLKHHIIS